MLDDGPQINFERMTFALLTKGPVVFKVDEFIQLMNGETDYKYLIITPDPSADTVIVEVSKTNDDA